MVFYLNNLKNYTFSNYYRFQNFVAIDKNIIAKNTAIDFASNKTNFNVLHIASYIGNGATHLAKAIINKMESDNCEEHYFICSYEFLVNEFRNNRSQNFFNPDYWNKYSSILIDSFYRADDANEEVLLNLFNAIKTKLIVTSNENIILPVNSFKIILEYPSSIDKSVIIENMIKELESYEFSNDAIDYLANTNTASIRYLENLINSSIVRAINNQTNYIDLPLVEIVVNHFKQHSNDF